MKLSDLIKLLNTLQIRLQQNGYVAGKHQPIMVEELMEFFLEKEGKFSNADFSKALNDYLGVIHAVETITRDITDYINKAKSFGLQEDDLIDAPLTKTQIKNIQALGGAYTRLIMEVHKIYASLQKKGALILNAEDYPSTAPESLKILCETLSGAFDANEVNQQLVTQKHYQLDNNYIVKGFADDHYCSYFSEQTHLALTRSAPKEGINKINDFVGRYLKQTGLPKQITPNLIGLLTTLSYQGGIVNTTCLDAFSMINVFSPEEGCLNVVQSGAYFIDFDFTQNGDIVVKFFSQALDKQVKLTSQINPVTPGIHLMTEVNLSISVNCNSQNEPTFVIETFSQNGTCFMKPKEAEMFNWQINESFLANNHSVDKKYIAYFEKSYTNLVNFAGYASVEDFCKEMDLIEGDIKLNQFFLDNLNLDTKVRDLFLNITTTLDKPAEVQAEKIANFVLKNVAELSDIERIQYIHLLKIAKNLGGIENRAVKKAYIELLDTIAKDTSLLILAFQTDPYLYDLYQIELDSFFGGRGYVKLTEEEHQVVQNFLELNKSSTDEIKISDDVKEIAVSDSALQDLANLDQPPVVASSKPMKIGRAPRPLPSVFNVQPVETQTANHSPNEKASVEDANSRPERSSKPQKSLSSSEQSLTEEQSVVNKSSPVKVYGELMQALEEIKLKNDQSKSESVKISHEELIETKKPDIVLNK